MSVKITNRLIGMLRDRQDSAFDGECHLSNEEADEIVSALEDAQRATLSAHTAEKGEAEPGAPYPWWVEELRKHWGNGESTPDTRRAALVAVNQFADPPAPRDDLVAGRLRAAIIELARAGSHLREFVRYHPEESTCDIEASLYMVGRIVGQYTNDHPEVLDACRAALDGRTDA